MKSQEIFLLLEWINPVIIAPSLVSLDIPIAYWQFGSLINGNCFSWEKFTTKVVFNYISENVSVQLVGFGLVCKLFIISRDSKKVVVLSITFSKCSFESKSNSFPSQLMTYTQYAEHYARQPYSFFVQLLTFCVWIPGINWLIILDSLRIWSWH